MKQLQAITNGGRRAMMAAVFSLTVCAAVGTPVSAQTSTENEAFLRGLNQRMDAVSRCVYRKDCADAERINRADQQMMPIIQGETARQGTMNSIRRGELDRQNRDYAGQLRMRSWDSEQEARKAEARGDGKTAQQLRDRARYYEEQAQTYQPRR